jgi:imidazolonepropionase-like amidohydrolase
MNIRKIAAFLIVLIQFSTQAQRPDPAPAQAESILLVGGTLHIGNGTVIENGAVGFDNGKITYAGPANGVDAAKFNKKVSTQGKQIYPGFILPNTILGLTEIDAVKASLDFVETGEINPNARALVAFNTDSKIIPTIRSNGVLLVQSTPRGGIISGTSSIMQLDAWNWEDAAYRADDGIHVNWPSERIRTGWWGEPGPNEENKRRKEQLNELKSILIRAKSYSAANNLNVEDLRLKALSGLFNGKQKLFIDVDNAKEIMEAVEFFESIHSFDMVIKGGAEAYLITDYLKSKNIPVILQRLHSLPPRADDDYDINYKMPYLLHKAGILYCLDYTGDMEAMGSRNLPFLAGTSVRYGLSKEQALMSITLNAAKILGIEKRTGSLEIGKDANIFISEGDALDMIGNQAFKIYIQGREIVIDNSQKALYESYRKKYGVD